MKLMILGLGYTATIFARRRRAAGDQVAGTVRDAERARALRAEGIAAMPFEAQAGELGPVAAALREAEALLVSVPPAPAGDPLPERLAADVRDAARLRWIGYLSTVGVYGDQGGAWIDETTPCAPQSARGRARLAAEEGWSELGRSAGKPVIVFRLPGIYGPSRNPLQALRAGSARRIVKTGQVFNRVHVGDIATALDASLAADTAGAVYNLTDDEPAPPQDVVAFAARLLNMAPPPEIPFEEAGLSPMAASFYGENKRVRNDLIKRALGFIPAFPSYREGLQALLAAGEGAG